MSAVPVPTREKVILSLVGTNDLHGHVEVTPVLGGYLANLRAARAKDGGDVLLVDAGDMFQGTLESNLGEGIAVLHAYSVLDYRAAAIGNHEFDFGPRGPSATPEHPGQDPRGALAALAASASFPFVNANLIDKSTHERFALPHSPASFVITAAGLRVGIVAVTSADTLETTISANVKDLEVAPLADTIGREAARLRDAEHADLVVVLAHAGGKCKGFSGDLVADQCEMDGEIFQVARKLPKGAVDAIVAGHTHQGLAHTVAGIPIIESFSYGKAFGRIDFTVEKSNGARSTIVATDIRKPEQLCVATSPETPGPGPQPALCADTRYEGAPVVPDPKVADAIAPDIARAKEKRNEPLGVVLAEQVKRDYDNESAEGNLFADLLRKAHPEATVVLMNGGGLRADLPKGPLTYGALFEAFPFDNKVATAKLRADDLARLFAAHFGRSGGILSASGIRVNVRCNGGRLEVTLEQARDGKKLAPGEMVTVLASDFMLTGGDGFWGPVARPEVTVTAELMRDTLDRELRKIPVLKERDWLDPKKPRLVFPGPRPVKCGEP